MFTHYRMFAEGMGIGDETGKEKKQKYKNTYTTGQKDKDWVKRDLIKIITSLTKRKTRRGL